MCLTIKKPDSYLQLQSFLIQTHLVYMDKPIGFNISKKAMELGINVKTLKQYFYQIKKNYHQFINDMNTLKQQTNE